MPPPHPFALSRRRLLSSLVGGSLLMPGILGELLNGSEPAAGASAADPLAPRPPHFPAHAKRVIFLYMSGGASHVDTFDYKPKLVADAGKKAPNGKFLKRPDFAFSPHGQSGMQISELFPHLGECADSLCMINSLKTDHSNHFEATLGIHTGSVTVARPSIGSWVSYALGTFNQNLPSFVVIAPHLPYAGGQVWSANFLPPCHQGTLLTPGSEPIPDLNRRLPSAALQDLELGMLTDLNRSHFASHDADPALAARIRSFETAAGMQLEAPAAFDLAGESDATLALYGLQRGQTTGFSWQCLVARRLAERGVRFIELIDTGAHDNWDSHSNMRDHVKLARNVDQPIAALLKDLKSRGMLDDTLVVWTTEFGRTPFVESADNKGREHHAACFTSWLAGGGAKPGLVHGQSDDYGIEVASHLVHLHDFHATILHLLGLDHERLTFRHAGRDFRLTDVAGNVIKELVV